MSLYKDICPIPFDQQPLNEYAQLKQLILFNWSTKPIHSFIKKLLAIFLLLIIINSIISIIITQNKYILLNLSNIYYSAIFATLTIKLIIIRLYLGWSYILKRLLSATVFYEESGWYDGQLWIKPSNILIQDRLVGIYQVMPIIRTLKVIFLLNTCFFILQVYFLFIN
uniref:Photosystem I assembly protein Ycf36 n=1 Tax=Sheathia arcuata TaxID=340433 RepID=A0A3G1I951_9FLOR|nr:photosystem I assembly protein Ycf36 [Sheathia arcuata]ART65468.1 photosystem I assembly protein Ycf36 [Sheathia arcuata]